MLRLVLQHSHLILAAAACQLFLFIMVHKRQQRKAAVHVHSKLRSPQQRYPSLPLIRDVGGVRTAREGANRECGISSVLCRLQPADAPATVNVARAPGTLVVPCCKNVQHLHTTQQYHERRCFSFAYLFSACSTRPWDFGKATCWHSPQEHPLVFFLGSVVKPLCKIGSLSTKLKCHAWHDEAGKLCDSGTVFVGQLS